MATYFDNLTGTEHVVAESSLLKATTAGHILSVKLHKDLDNGSIIGKGTYVGGQVFNSANYASGTMYLLLTPPLAYNTSITDYTAEKYFYNALGEIGRAYELVKDDIFTLSAAAFSSTPAVGKYAKWDATDSEYDIQDAATNAQFLVIGTVSYQNSTSYQLLVL